MILLDDPLSDVLAGAFTGAYGIVVAAIYVLAVIALWKVFTKAGYFGLLALIPIVNLFVYTRIAGWSAWATLLYLIPVVNVVFAIMVAIRVGRGFGKGGLWSFFLLWMFAIIGFFILGFGRARYTRPV